MVELGVQSVDPEIRSSVLHRFESNAIIERALDACQAVGLTTQVDHILGIPGEEVKRELEAAEFYAKYGGDIRVALFHLTYYPRTAVVQMGREKGWIGDEQARQIDMGLEPSIYYQGSIHSEERIRTGRDLQALFRLMPVLPGVGQRLADSGHWRHLGRMPWAINVALEMATSAKNRDTRALAYLKFYAKHLPRTLLEVSR